MLISTIFYQYIKIFAYLIFRKYVYYLAKVTIFKTYIMAKMEMKPIQIFHMTTARNRRLK